MGVGAGRIPRDPAAGAVGGGRTAVEGGGQLEHHPRPPGAAVLEIGGELSLHLGRTRPHGDVHAGLPQRLQAPTGHVRVGVLDADHHPPHPSGHDGVGAGRGPPVVGTRLQGDVHGGAPGPGTGRLQSPGLGVGTPRGLGGALHLLASTVEYGAHPRVGRGRGPDGGGQLHGPPHPCLVRHARSSTANAGARQQGRRALAPIRTLTVGPGVPPGRPPTWAGGSRALTAGRDFHPTPRGAWLWFS